jgi:hypothetical protein
MGDHVVHPHLGHGRVTGTGEGPGHGDNYVSVRFGSGRHKFEVRRTAGVPGFRPRTGTPPAQKAAHAYTMAGVGLVEGKLGGQSAWNGTVNLWPAHEHPGVAAYMHWTGAMSYESGVAHHIAQNTDPHAAAENVTSSYDMHVPLHEIFHSVVPHGEDYRDSSHAYQDAQVAAIEEGFTELGASYHAEEFFTAQGIGHRQTLARKPDGSQITLAEMARTRADPSAIAKGDSWGAYRKETAAALAWTRAVAKAEGLPADLRSKRTQRRLRELSDEVNAASPRGKADVMARQMLRARGVTDRPRKTGYDLSGEVWQIMRQKLDGGKGMAAAASAAHDYLDPFTWKTTSG